MVSAVILAAASLLASGWIFEHRRLTTYLAAAGTLWWGAWLLLTLIARGLLPQIESSTIFLVGSVLLLLGAIVGARTWSLYIPWGQKRHDVVGDGIAIALTLLVIAGAAIVVTANGFSDHTWVGHGFYNGDTATFTALTNRSFTTNTLVRENPFAGNGPLEYPTLLHAGMAELLTPFQSTGSWLYLLPSLAYITLAATIPMFFLAADIVSAKTKQHIAIAIIITLVLTTSWDTYVYPQSHFFITGLFVLLSALLFRANEIKDGRKVVVEIFAGLLALVLVLSNAVTGTAALAVFGMYLAWQVFNPQRSTGHRVGAVILGGLLLLAFFLHTPGNASFGGIQFSYTAAVDAVRLAPLLTLLVAGVLLARRNNLVMTSLPVTLVALGLVTFFFSTRDIVVENASRFFYHALLFGFPLMVVPFTRLTHSLRDAWKQEHASPARAVLAVVIGITCGIAVLPNLASMASAYDNLLFKDTHTVDTPMRAALWWIEENTAPDAIFLASPEAPFAIPAFTGRSLLRTNNWLSPEDVVQSDVNAAFAGDAAAREKVFGLTDYALFAEEERGLFEPLPAAHEKVFDNNAVIIYQLSKE